jgi:peptidoglycan DL-endopeptidase CwlO
VVVVLASAAAAASGSYRDRVQSLRSDASALDARSHRALLDLYALDTRLQAAQSHLVSLQVAADRLQSEQAILAQQISATRHALSVSQRELAAHLRDLYEQGDVDPVAVVLGATSLDDAMTKLDALSRVADQSRRVVDVTTAARGRLDTLRSALATRRTRLRDAIASAQRATNELASARAERVAFIARLRSAEQLKAEQIATLETAARQVERKAASLQTAASAQPAAATPDASASAGASPVVGARTMTVVATGYSLGGSTATGAPVGPGVVAVDPSVIPLGTSITIPGYGEGVAADTGVSGASIDLWFSTPAQAHAWGRRTVTITLH